MKTMLIEKEQPTRYELLEKADSREAHLQAHSSSNFLDEVQLSIGKSSKIPRIYGNSIKKLDR